MNFADLQRRSNEIAKAHGWWDEPRTFGDLIALIHSEASEALEEYRKTGKVRGVYTRQDGKPEGVPYELADVVIRVMDMAEQFGLPLENYIERKLDYNEKRDHRHGGKKL